MAYYKGAHSIERENKRKVSRSTRYRNLTAEEREDITKKQIATRAKNRKMAKKIKRTVRGKHYYRNNKIKISGFHKYTIAISHILKSRKCKYCGKGYYNRHMGKDFCSKECYEKYRTEIGWIGLRKCKLCGKEFKPKRLKNSTYCSVQCANRDRERNHKTLSDINIYRGERLKTLGYTPYYEYPLGSFSYDILIGNNILIEVNPSVFHSSTYSPYGNEYIKNKMYHYNKTHYAIDNGYKCINIRDRTSKDEIIQMINNDFIYEGLPRLHWCNRKTREYYNNQNENKYTVGVYDSGMVKFI